VNSILGCTAADENIRSGRRAARYDPPLTGDTKLEFVHQDQADRPDLVRCWLQKEPARRLPNLTRIPVVIISAEASLSRRL
jgi:hypothetical protein